MLLLLPFLLLLVFTSTKAEVVKIEDYAYLVPYVESEEDIFLKTIIPSRKATRQFLGDSNE